MGFLIEKFRSNPHLYTAVFFTCVSCFFFLPIVLQGKLLAPGDALIQYLPAFGGGTHIWTTKILCGFPWYADPQSQTFYPLKQIFSVLPAGWNLYIIAAYTLAGFFAALYAVSVTGSWTAALIAGCIYAFNGFLLSNLRHTTILHSAIWLPLGLWAIRGFRKENFQCGRKAASWFCLTVLATVLLSLAGHPQMFCYGLALLGGYAIAETFEIEKESRLLFVVLSLLAIALGVGISTITILPGAELASFSWRWNMTYQMFIEYALIPVNLINLVFPFAFGSFKNSIYGCNYFGPYDLQCVLGYCGLLTWLLFPLGILVFRREKIIVFWTIVLLVFFILIFGDVKPLSQIAYQLPCYSRFRIPTRHFLEISMALSCLSAAGVSALAGNKITQAIALRSHALFTGFFIIASVVVYLVAGASQERVRETASGVFGLYPWTNPAIGIPIVLFVLGSVIFVLCLKRPQMRWHALILFFVIDFATVAMGSEYMASSPSAKALEQPKHAEWLNAQAAKTHQRVLSLRGNSGNANELPVNLSMLWNVENASGYENLLPMRISNLLNMKEGGFITDNTWAKDENHTLDILAVKYILIPKDDSRYPAPTGERWGLIKDLGDTLVYENRRAMPRAWLVHSAMVLPEKEIVTALQTGKAHNCTVNPADQVFVTESGFDYKKPDGDKVEILTVNDTEMVVRVQTKEEGLLVTSDSFYPGWQVFEDDKLTDTKQANYLLRAARVSKGTHTLKFVFSPQPLKVGLTLFLASVAAVAAIAIWLLRRKQI